MAHAATANGSAKSAKASGANGRRRSKGSAAGYDALKEFDGQRYTGMKVGRGHKWHYAPGEWKETKVTPDKWEFHYEVGKRRAGHAPEGSGAPVGTEYHWYILAHQTVTKQDANNYSTAMHGVKYKLAHKRADKDAWNQTSPAQCRRLIAILKEAIAELEQKAAALPARARPAARAAKRTKKTGSSSKATRGARVARRTPPERLGALAAAE